MWRRKLKITDVYPSIIDEGAIRQFCDQNPARWEEGANMLTTRLMQWLCRVAFYMGFNLILRNHSISPTLSSFFVYRDISLSTIYIWKQFHALSLLFSVDNVRGSRHNTALFEAGFGRLFLSR